MIRGTCVLPAGTGKEVKICVFADGEMHQELKDVGADLIGTDEVLLGIADGKIEFDKLICTQEYLPSLKKFARLLGPKGLMPNVKSGTLVKQEELLECVKLSKQGLIEYKINSEAFIMNRIGLRDFENDKLEENFDALMVALVNKKPDAIKGRYFLKGIIKTTMGSPVQVDMSKYAKLVADKSTI